MTRGNTSEGGLVDVEQAAEFLGVKVKALYRLVEAKKVPFHRVGDRFVRFDLRELSIWTKAKGHS